MLSDFVELMEWATMLLGVAFCMLAGVGVTRMPDVYTRMQASTKAGTLGISLIIAAVAIHFRDAVTGLQASLIIAFIFLTAPIASHLIARAAHVLGVATWEHTVMDEMADHRRPASGRRTPPPGA